MNQEHTEEFHSKLIKLTIFKKLKMIIITDETATPTSHYTRTVVLGWRALALQLLVRFMR